MAPTNNGLFASNLEERTRRNLDRIVSLLGMATNNLRTVAPDTCMTDSDGTRELFRLWSTLDCFQARARVLDHLRAEVATQASDT